MVEVQKGIPEIGLKFRNPDEAWKFWVAYGGRTGFDVRKRYTNVSKCDGKVTSCRFVCANEGHRRKGQTDLVTKCFRAETRTDELILLIDNALDCLGTQLENFSISAMDENICTVQENIDPNVQQSNEFLGATKLKKKEAQPKKLRRQRTWLDKLRKSKRKPANKSPAPEKKRAKQQKQGDGGLQPRVELEKDDNNKSAIVEFQDLGCFTQLITAPTCNADNLEF